MNLDRLIYLATLNESDYKEFEGKHNGQVGIPYLDIGIKGDWQAKQQTMRQIQRMMGIDLTERSQETVLHNGWSATGLEAYKACLQEHEDLILTASPLSVEEPEFSITLFWKPRPSGIGKVNQLYVTGGKILSTKPTTIQPNDEVNIKVARVKNSGFQLVANISGISATFELPRQPKKLQVQTRDWSPIKVGSATSNKYDFVATPTPGFEFVPASLFYSAAIDPSPPTPVIPEYRPTALVKTVNSTESQLSLTLVTESNTINKGTTGTFGVSIKEIKSVDD